MAWLVGFITTDGNIRAGRDSKGRVQWCITIVQKEREILEAICDEIRLPRYKIIETTRLVKLPQGTTGIFTTHRISFTNKHMVERLIALGMMPNKSLQITKIHVPKKYFAHFLRGVFDGDGCFSWGGKSGHQTPRASFAGGSPQFLKWLMAKVSEYYEMPGGRLHQKSTPNAWSLSYNKNCSLKLAGLMYLGPEVGLCLSRKKENFLSCLAYHGIDLSAHETPGARFDYFYNLVKI